MSAKHPGFDRWREFIVHPESVEDREAMESHVASCDRCAQEVELLQSLATAGAVGAWAQPPDAILDEVLGVSRQAIAPSAPETVEELDWELADVRGDGASLAEEGIFLARSLEGVQLSLLVHPPREDGRWSIEGRVWLDPPHGAGAELFLVSGEHVVASQKPGDSGRFEFLEVVGAGWELELRLFDGRTILLRDPLA